MTKKLFFDTDCISSFLWVNEENLLLKLYPKRIILPQEVFNELSNPSIPHIKSKIALLYSKGDIATQGIQIDTEEYNLYYQLAIAPPGGEKIIGKGEAAAISLTKVYGGILASNNMKDISKYIEKFKLDHITTGDILKCALKTGLITESTGNRIWEKMLSKRRFLPAASFSEYLKNDQLT